MEVTRIRALRGPNLWSRHTAIEAVVRTEGAECTIGALPGFEDRLCARFPNIGPMHPIGHEGDISVAHALAFAALTVREQFYVVTAARQGFTHLTDEHLRSLRRRKRTCGDHGDAHRSAHSI